MGRIIWFIIIALILFWLLGLVFKVAGGLIHILLVLAGIFFIFRLITRKRSL